MREAFDTVRGAVSTKDLVPVLTHFAFNAGRVYGANGRVQISAPVPELSNLSLTVPAVPFIAAMDGCEDAEPKIKFADDALTVSTKKFRAKIPVRPFADFPLQSSPGDGAYSLMKPGLLESLRVLRPLVGEDASRPWCATIRIAEGRAYAANNVVLAVADTVDAVEMPYALPVFAVDELLRIGAEPQGCVVDDTGVEFLLPGDITLRAQLLAGAWPDVDHVLSAAHNAAQLRAIDSAAILRAVEAVRPFCDDMKLPRIKLLQRTISAVGSAMSAEITGFKGFGDVDMTFHADLLSQVLPLAQAVDWGRFPRVPFTGPGIKGVFLGIAPRI